MLSDGNGMKESAAIVKRKNTTKACNECRRRRAKCDGQKPVCARCSSKNTTCSYSTEDDGRQPAPKSYVLMLRKRIDFLEKTLQTYGIDVNKSFVARLAAEGSQTQTSNNGVHLSSFSDTFKPGADAEPSSEIDNLSTALAGTLSLDDAVNFDGDGEHHYFGPTSGRLEFLESQRKNSTEKTLCNHLDISSHGYNEYHSPPERYVKQFSNIPAFSQELRTHLEDLYFTWQHPWYPIVNRRLFRNSENTGGRYFSPLLLNCILAVGSLFSDRIEVRMDPDNFRTAGQIFTEEIESLMQIELKWPTLTTIQSLCVASQFYISTGSDTTCWLYQGIANRLALDMGLNVDPGSVQSLSHEEIQLRRQMYWAIYCEDKLASSYTGRVCSMLDCQGAVKWLSSSQDLDGKPLTDATYSGDDSVLDLQLGLSKLCHIMEEIFLSLYAPKPLLHGAQASAFLNSCLLDLKNWYYDLHKNLKIDRSNKQTILPQVYTLHMVYRTAHILLAKYFLPRRSAFRTSSQTTRSSDSVFDDATVDRASRVCCDAAQEICTIATKYRQAYGGFRRSPITATHCTLAAALVLIRAQQSDEIPSLTNSSLIELCVDVLGELSTSWLPAYQIRLRLEILTQKEIVKHGSIEKITHAERGADLEIQRSGQGSTGNSIKDDPEPSRTSELPSLPTMTEFEKNTLMDFSTGMTDLAGWDWGLQDLDMNIQFDDAGMNSLESNTLPRDYINFNYLYDGQLDER